MPAMLMAPVVAGLLSTGAFAAGPAEGLFYQLPPDGTWARFRVSYTFKAGEQQQSGEQTLWMASVGEVTEQGEPCRWIEFRQDAVENGVKRFWIRKLLIPVRYLKQGENPTAHVLRGWTQQETGDVEPAVAVHGRWPALLAGPLQDQKQLPPATVRTSLGTLTAEGFSGWITFDEGNQRSRVTFETRVHPKAPFGVLASRMVFDVSIEGTSYTIDSTAELAGSGVGATTALPEHR